MSDWAEGKARDWLEHHMTGDDESDYASLAALLREELAAWKAKSLACERHCASLESDVVHLSAQANQLELEAGAAQNEGQRLRAALDEVLAFLRRASSGPKEIVSTGLLTEQQIANYRSADLMYVEPGGGLGWVVRERRVLEMAEKERDTALAALSLLVDHQNGPPLPKYEKGWNEAMNLARAALASASKCWTLG